MKNTVSGEDMKMEKFSNELKQLNNLFEDKNNINEIRICNLEQSAISQRENISKILENLNNPLRTINSFNNISSSAKDIANTADSDKNNLEHENASNDKSNNNGNIPTDGSTKGLLKLAKESKGENASSKEIMILKTNFEMQIGNLKNEIRNINKDINNKNKELYLYISSQINELENSNNDKTFNKTKKSEIFKMPNFDNIDNKNSNDQKFDDFENNPVLRVINSRLLDLEDKIFDMEDIKKNNLRSKNLNVLNSKIDDLNNSNLSDNSNNLNNNSNTNTNTNNKKIIKLIKNLSSNLLFNDFICEKINQENKRFEKYIENIKVNSEDNIRINTDIGKLYESVLAVRKIVNEKENFNPEFDMETIENLNVLQNKFDDLSKNYEKKINDLDKLSKKLKDTIEESTKGISDKDDHSSGNNLKDFFHYISRNLKILSDKIDKNGIKLDNFSGEVMSKLKKEFSCKKDEIL